MTWRHTGGVLLAALAGCAPPEPTTALPPFVVRGRWADPHALRYRVDADPGPLPTAEVERAIARALAVWAAVDGIGFVACGTHEVADVVFAWGDAASDAFPDAPFGRDTSVAITGPVGPVCRVLFDRSRTWTTDGRDTLARPSLFQTAVHETGHVLGLGHVEDTTSVLHPQREIGRSALGPGDLAGLHSLYGGGVDHPGDLVVERAGAPALRRVAPAEATDWCMFDTDGDGDDEVLVWATGARGHGALTVYHFGPGCLLVRTVGPVLGVAGPGAQLTPVVTDAGRGLLVRRQDGDRVLRRFDARGKLSGFEPAPAGEPAPPRQQGDLDGDGTADVVHRRS